MESILDVKEALQARSTTATLDDLKSQGRKRVRLIRPEHIATMIQEAVSRALEGSNLVAPEEVQRLVTESRTHFQTLMKERERELESARQAASELEEVRAELSRAQERISELEAGSGPTGGSPHLVQKLTAEIAALKAQAGTPAAAMGANANEATIAAALEKLAGSLNERLDKFGRKIGVSGAVEEAPLDYGKLFAQQDVAAPLESNLDSVKLKQKSGGGIAQNLERLRKLKGNG